MTEKAFTLSKKDILKDNSDFKRVSERGRAYSSRFFILKILDNSLPANRAGFSISKKKCKLSSGRNRIKRLLREAYRLNKSKILRGFDLLFILKTEGKKLNLDIVNEEINSLFKKANIFVN